jgi:hypothetical protein
VALLLGALYTGAGAAADRIVTNTACLFFFLLFLFFSNAMPTINSCNYFVSLFVFATMGLFIM